MIEVEAARKATLTPDSSHGGSPVVSSGPVPSRSTSQHKNKRAYVSEEEESGNEYEESDNDYEESDNDYEESGDEREDARTNPKPPGMFLPFGSGHC